MLWENKLPSDLYFNWFQKYGSTIFGQIQSASGFYWPWISSDLGLLMYRVDCHVWVLHTLFGIQNLGFWTAYLIMDTSSTNTFVFLISLRLNMATFFLPQCFFILLKYIFYYKWQQPQEDDGDDIRNRIKYALFCEITFIGPRKVTSCLDR